MITHELKACPFCGSNSIKIEPESEGQPAYAFCKECVTIGPSAIGTFDAMYYWNSREEISLPVDCLLNIRQVCQVLGLSRATIYRLIQKEQFPAPIHPKGTKASRWRVQDIEEYQESSINSKSQPVEKIN